MNSVKFDEFNTIHLNSVEFYPPWIEFNTILVNSIEFYSPWIEFNTDLNPNPNPKPLLIPQSYINPRDNYEELKLSTKSFLSFLGENSKYSMRSFAKKLFRELKKKNRCEKMAESYILVHHSGEIINTKEVVIFRKQNPQNMGSVIHATSPNHVNMARSTDAD